MTTGAIIIAVTVIDVELITNNETDGNKSVQCCRERWKAGSFGF